MSQKLKIIGVEPQNGGTILGGKKTFSKNQKKVISQF